MTTNTHCRPAGSLGTNELRVTGINSRNTYLSRATSSPKRGCLVFMHGLYAIPTGIGSVPPNPGVLSFSPFGSNYAPPFIAAVNADGWDVIMPPYNEDACGAITPAAGILLDVTTDTGTRYLRNTLLWWDHVVQYVHDTFGDTYPILAFGGSWGGWHCTQVAIYEQAKKALGHTDIVAWAAGDPLTTPGVIGHGYTLNLAYQDWQTIDSSALDLSTTCLDGVTIPGAVSCGNADAAVGFSSTTVGASSNGQTIAVGTPPSGGILYVADNTQLAGAGAMGLKLIGLTGGTGSAIVEWTGTSGSTQLTGVTVKEGSGTLVTGGGAIQNTIIQAATSANSHGQSVASTVFTTAGDTAHGFGPAAATYFENFITTTVDPLAPAIF